MAGKKKELFNPIESLQSILHKDQYQFDEDVSEDNLLYSEIPVDITTFVSSPEWLGMAPQKHINGQKGPDGKVLVADAPLSPQQLEFIEQATDFENGVTNLILWVG